jgi:hypothetical protein
MGDTLCRTRASNGTETSEIVEMTRDDRQNRRVRDKLCEENARFA